MAKAWLARGFAVDAIPSLNNQFIPARNYDFFVGARTYFEAIADRLNPD
jgi:hypothetical protein